VEEKALDAAWPTFEASFVLSEEQVHTAAVTVYIFIPR